MTSEFKGFAYGRTPEAFHFAHPFRTVVLHVQRLAVFPDGSYEPDDKHGLPYTVVCVENRDEWPVDFCAWDHSNPGSWWRRWRTGPCLGAPFIQYCQESLEPLPLHPTPESWLQSHCTGAVILDWSEDPRLLFEGIQRIDCQSQALEQKLKGRIEEVSRPHFEIASKSESQHVAA